MYVPSSSNNRLCWYMYILFRYHHLLRLRSSLFLCDFFLCIVKTVMICSASDCADNGLYTRSDNNANKKNLRTVDVSIYNSCLNVDKSSNDDCTKQKLTNKQMLEALIATGTPILLIYLDNNNINNYDMCAHKKGRN